MKLRYHTVNPWLAYKQSLIKRDWDDLNLITGREGKGKSKWARKVARKLDPTFTLDRIEERIHFDYSTYKEALSTLTRGQCIILDEARLHRRESMTKQRMEILDDFKENRGLGIHHFIVFNRMTKVDQDLVTDRVADWSYIRDRGRVEVRQPKTELWFDAEGTPHEDTQYPLVGHWTFTDSEPPGWREAYEKLKNARMRDRQATKREPEAPKPQWDSRLLELALREHG